jgi:UDP-galactose-lipid carrier transferase
LEAEQSELRDQLIRQLSQHQVRRVSVIPAMRGVPLFGLQTTQFFSHEVLMIHVRNQLAKPLLRAFKRVFDLVGSATLLVLLSPLFTYVAYKVSRDGGSAFFGHERVGQNGQKFKCYKFRSMVVNAQEVLQDLLARDEQARAEWAKDFKLKNDPRINPIGHFLRRTSLDELPQLWNVLMGEMSLVGPRPVVQAELERYGDDVVYYLMAKPGMTGLWQVSGRNDVDYDTRVYFDAWYVKNWSLWTDIAILFKTISVVFNKNGAY